MKILVNCLPSSVDCHKKWTLLKANKQNETDRLGKKLRWIKFRIAR